MPACDCKPVLLWQNPKKIFLGASCRPAHIIIFPYSKNLNIAHTPMLCCILQTPPSKRGLNTTRPQKQHTYPTQNGNFVCFNNINNIFKNIVDLT